MPDLREFWTSEDGLFLFSLAGVVLFSMLIGYGLGHMKGRPWDGLALGFLLGPLGCVIAILLPKRGRQCPFCLGIIASEARKCMHCASDLPEKIPSLKNPFG
jgi:hypothetical protein